MPHSGVGVVIVAAGSGSRLGAQVPKAFVPLAGEPILRHAVRGALACPEVSEIVVVAPPGWAAEAEEVCRSARLAQPAPTAPAGRTPAGRTPAAGAGFAPRTSSSSGPAVHLHVVAGGPERGDSVAAGVAALSDEVAVVLVHDAARCLTPVEVFDRVIEAVRGGARAVVPVLPVVDTIKEVDASGRVVATPDRARLRSVQTPQGFRRDVLERAHAVSSDATDDATLVERLGEPVLVCDGDARALKVTTPADLAAAARILTG